MNEAWINKPAHSKMICMYISSTPWAYSCLPGPVCAFPAWPGGRLCFGPLTRATWLQYKRYWRLVLTLMSSVTHATAHCLLHCQRACAARVVTLWEVQAQLLVVLLLVPMAFTFWVLCMLCWMRAHARMHQGWDGRVALMRHAQMHAHRWRWQYDGGIYRMQYS